MDITEYLSREELAGFKQKNNVKAFAMLFANWACIFAIFAFAYIWPNPISIVLAMALLAGRQLGLAVLMHDAGHNLLFETKSLNQFFGQWFCANAILQDLPSYANGHLNHHKMAGTPEDPDLKNYQHYPITKASFIRKIKRDLSGQTGWKLLKLVLRAASGIFVRGKRKNAMPFIQEFFVQLVLLAVLTLTMSAWLYLLWIGSWLTFYMLIVRLRQVAEHAAVEDLLDKDPRKNTRTTIPNLLERVFIAPNYVNYHLEHHLFIGVPCYQLGNLHRHLQSAGAYSDTKIAYGYRQVLREAIVF